MSPESAPASPEKTVIKTIAKEAGVSVATVSRVINNLPNVTEKTREKVMAVMKSHNYHPSMHAQGLNRRVSSRLVGLVSDMNRVSQNHSYFTEIIRGLEEGALRKEYCLLFMTPEQFDQPNMANPVNLVDGLVVISLKIGDPLIRKVESMNKPYVLLNCVSSKSGHVDINNLSGAQTAVEHLIQKHGQKQIAFVSGPSEHMVFQERFIGYKSTMNRYNIAIKEDWIIQGNFDQESGARAAEKLLSLPQKPTAIFAANDYLAIGIIEHLKKVGLRVPSDLAVVGFDDIHAAAHMSPGLTTIHQPLFEMGLEAMEQATLQIEKKGVKIERKYLQPQLQIRQSCGCL